MNHYVYLIEKRNALPNKEKYYIGVRSCEGKIGDDKYMGSSKYLAEDMLINKESDYNKIILKRFNSRKQAMNYEIKLHKDFNVSSNHLFFNKVKQTTDGFSCGPGELNPFYGKRHTEEYKEKQRELMKTKNCVAKKLNFGLKHTKETKLLMSLRRKEWMSKNVHPMAGRDRKNEANLILAVKNQRRETCKICGITSTVGNIVRWHNDKCKNRS